MGIEGPPVDIVFESSLYIGTSVLNGPTPGPLGVVDSDSYLDPTGTPSSHADSSMKCSMATTSSGRANKKP